MSKVVITDLNKFEKIINDLEKTIPEINDIFIKQNRNFEMINGTDNYRGDSQAAISEKYATTKNNYQPINDALINYIKYLKITLRNYKEFERVTGENIDNNKEELNVN